MEIRRTTSAPPEQVWAVLADGWMYPTWVVGASRMRAVDPSWPAEGSRLHHSFGAWPVMLDDVTEVLVSDPPHRLKVQAHGWPLGEATVDVRVDEWASGAMLSVAEDATRGPGTLVPAPLRQLAVVPRNREALRRLAFLAERRGSE